MPTGQTNIEPGEILEGKVQGITKFGAFVELPGGAVGLVHISEIANTYVKEVKDFIREGDTVKVKVLNIAGKKIGLSIKQAMPASPVVAGPQRTGRSPAREYNVPPQKGSTTQMSLDDKIARFLKESDERMQPLKNKLEPRRKRNHQ